MVETGVSRIGRPAFPQGKDEHSVHTGTFFGAPNIFFLLSSATYRDTISILKKISSVPSYMVVSGLCPRHQVQGPCTPNVLDVPTPMVE